MTSQATRNRFAHALGRCLDTGICWAKWAGGWPRVSGVEKEDAIRAGLLEAIADAQEALNDTNQSNHDLQVLREMVRRSPSITRPVVPFASGLVCRN